MTRKPVRLDSDANNMYVCLSVCMYVDRCAPTRSALMTGRLPIHVLAQTDHVSRGYTMLPKKLQQVGYSTHQIGKVGASHWIAIFRFVACSWLWVSQNMQYICDVHYIHTSRQWFLCLCLSCFFFVLFGQWHLGYQYDHLTPLGRGFNTSLGYLGGGEDHYTQVS